jgi:hypothetical protein
LSWFSPAKSAAVRSKKRFLLRTAAARSLGVHGCTTCTTVLVVVVVSLSKCRSWFIGRFFSEAELLTKDETPLIADDKTNNNNRQGQNKQLESLLIDSVST